MQKHWGRRSGFPRGISRPRAHPRTPYLPSLPAKTNSDRAEYGSRGCCDGKERGHGVDIIRIHQAVFRHGDHLGGDFDRTQFMHPVTGKSKIPGTRKI